MNKYIYSAAAFLSLSCLALTSCQSEMEQLGGTQSGHEVLLRVTANRGDAETRTTLEHDGYGGLACKWSEGDQLMVVDSKGKKIGVITLVAGAETSEGTFEGNVTLEGQEDISLVYLGTAENAVNFSADANYIAIDLTQQDGTFASLTNKDVLTSSSYVVDNSYSSNEVTVENVTLTRQLAFGYFTLSFPDDITLAADDVITITGEGLKSTGKVNFRNGGSVPTVANPSTTITITKAEAGNDFYVTMLPCGDVTPKFTVVKDNVTYIGVLGTHSWTTGEYVRAGEMQGVVISMAKAFENPLAKWAKGDLVRSGSGKSVTGTVSDNPWVAGSYYEFGRNYGYNSASEVTLLSTEINLSNNYFTFRGTKYTATPENGVYSASSKKVQKNQNATSITQMSDYPEMFFMNDGDYVFPGYTETWSQRAMTNGYSRETPCPAGWTIPSRSDFEEILPVVNNKVGSTSWSVLTQVKLIGRNKVPCAFRWSQENGALKIECVVLTSENETPNWSDPSAEVRYFKLSGCLTSFMQSGKLTQGNNSTVQYVANVLDYGKYDTTRTLGSSYGGTNIYYMKVKKLADYMGKTGFYWTCDADQQVFTLINTDSQISSYPNVGYYFTKSSVTIGANIRCIKK